MNILKTTIFAAAMGSALCMSSCLGEDPVDKLRPDATTKPTTPAAEKTIGDTMDELLELTSCFNPDEKRMKLIDIVQAYCDACTKANYDTYYKTTSASESAKMEDGTILSYYKEALKRVKNEVETAGVPQGKIVVWHLYNMGYIVKTPSHCFGIDIKHKDAAELVPYLDFLLITHKHVDHYSDELNAAMKLAGKPVFSNFVENDYLITGKKTFKPADDIEIVTGLGDHSASQKNFNVIYQIDCGADTGHKVILHIGDTYNATQLFKTKPIDIFIPHAGINLNFTQAMNKIAPSITLLSHIDELSHALDNYRWPYNKAFDRVSQLAPNKAYIPVWGERMEF